MEIRKVPVSGILLLCFSAVLFGQNGDSVRWLCATVYNRSFEPVPACHVINLNSHAGDVTDSLGIFCLPVSPGDSLLVSNIAYRDTVVRLEGMGPERIILIRHIYYPLEEARIFEWGATYGDFRQAIIHMPDQQTLGESMGLPRQDPDYIPFDMNESYLKSTNFLIHSPLSYLYYNLSRKEKSRRWVFWQGKDREGHEAFETIVSPESLSEVTGLEGEELLEFMSYLFQRMVCDFKCSEIDIYEEIYSHWEVYRNIVPSP
jgi:hypothetical protein